MDINHWISLQKQRLFENSETNDDSDCILCKLGGETARYSTLSVTFPWIKLKKTIYAHRLIYMLNTKQFELPKDMQVSHKCHNRRCINMQHLSLEPQYVNRDREQCRELIPVRCKTHFPYDNCIL